jgi:hypothetical protein
VVAEFLRRKTAQMSRQRNEVGIYRSTPLAIQADPRFRALSVTGKLILHTLFAGMPTSQIPGVIAAAPGTVAHHLGISIEQFMDCWRSEIEEMDWARADWAAGFIYVPSAIELALPARVNIVRTWRRTWELLPGCALKDEAADAILRSLDCASIPAGNAFRKILGSAPIEKKEKIEPKIENNSSENHLKIRTELFSENKKKRGRPRKNPELKKDFFPTPFFDPTFPGNRIIASEDKTAFSGENLAPIYSFASGAAEVEKIEEKKEPCRGQDQDQDQEQKQEQDQEYILKREEQIGDSYESPQCRVGGKSAKTVESEGNSDHGQVPSVDEVTEPSSESMSSIETPTQRRSGPSTPPPIQRALFGPAVASRVEQREPAPKPKKAKSALKFPDLCRRVVDELNRARSAVAPQKNLRGLESASDSGLQLLDGRIAELMGKFGEADEVVGILSDVVWARAWELGIAPRGGNELEDWHGKFKWLNLSAPFTGPHGGKQGGWIMSEAIRAEWIEAGRPEPYQKRARVRDIRQGSIVAAYDPEDFANVEAIHNHRQAEMRREYIEKLTREGKEIPEYILNEY